MRTSTTSTVDVSGTCDAGSTISIRNEEAPGGAFNSQVVGTDGKFKLTVPVVAGPNTIDLSATDQAGNSSSTSLTVNRDYGQLAAHLAVTPSKFSSSSQTTLKLTLHATSLNGGPLANAKVTFTVTIEGLGPIVSPELTTDATGTATWQVAISGALAGTGQASVLVTSPAGDQVTRHGGHHHDPLAGPSARRARRNRCSTNAIAATIGPWPAGVARTVEHSSSRPRSAGFVTARRPRAPRAGTSARPSPSDWVTAPWTSGRAPLTGEEERACWERSSAETADPAGPAFSEPTVPAAESGRGLWGTPAPSEDQPDRPAVGHGMWTEPDSIATPRGGRLQHGSSIRSRPWGPVPGLRDATGWRRGLRTVRHKG